MASTVYKQRIVDYLREFPDGLAMEDVRARFSRAPLREMEQIDKTIFFENQHWHAAALRDAREPS